MERPQFIKLMKDILKEETGNKKIRAECLGKSCLYDDSRKICVLCRLLKDVEYVYFTKTEI